MILWTLRMYFFLFLYLKCAHCYGNAQDNSVLYAYLINITTHYSASALHKTLHDGEVVSNLQN